VPTSRAFSWKPKRGGRREEKEVEKKNLLDSIGGEIGTLWNFPHMQRIGAMSRKPARSGALEFLLSLTQIISTCYNTNAGR